MTNDELLKKDLPLITCQCEILNTAYLRVIFANQAFIISELTKRPITDVMQQMNERVKLERGNVDKMVKTDFKDVADIIKFN